MKLLTIIGTRPEAVKMAPVLRAVAIRAEVNSRICATGQHAHLLGPPLASCGLVPDVQLDVMKEGQSPAQVIARTVDALNVSLRAERPDRVLVQGDTATALAGALAAEGRGIPVSHIEAGLRSHCLNNPWPEEGFRRAIDAIADQLFAPTPLAEANLRDEGRGPTGLFVTGNSGIDALHQVIGALACDRELRRRSDAELPQLPGSGPVALMTTHRRENIGAPLARICSAARLLAKRGIQLVVPVHPNPGVRAQVEEALAGREGIHLVPPLSHAAMVRMMARADLILTDSGGVQEEAPSFGKPVLVLREVTERPEAVSAGIARIVGSCIDTILEAAEAALCPSAKLRIAAPNPYGDGRAAQRIVAGLIGEAFQPFCAAEPVPRLGPSLLAV